MARWRSAPARAAVAVRPEQDAIRAEALPARSSAGRSGRPRLRATRHAAPARRRAQGLARPAPSSVADPLSCVDRSVAPGGQLHSRYRPTRGPWAPPGDRRRRRLPGAADEGAVKRSSRRGPVPELRARRRPHRLAGGGPRGKPRREEPKQTESCRPGGGRSFPDGWNHAVSFTRPLDPLTRDSSSCHWKQETATGADIGDASQPMTDRTANSRPRATPLRMPSPGAFSPHRPSRRSPATRRETERSLQHDPASIMRRRSATALRRGGVLQRSDTAIRARARPAARTSARSREGPSWTLRATPRTAPRRSPGIRGRPPRRRGRRSRRGFAGKGASGTRPRFPPPDR